MPFVVLWHSHPDDVNRGKKFAETEWWDYSELLADTSYGQFYDGKCKRRERIENKGQNPAHWLIYVH